MQHTENLLTKSETERRMYFTFLRMTLGCSYCSEKKCSYVRWGFEPFNTHLGNLNPSTSSAFGVFFVACCRRFRIPSLLDVLLIKFWY